MNNIMKSLMGAIDMKSAAWRGISLAFTLSLVLAFAVVASTLMVPAAVAQSSNGTIVGTVTDNSGAAVPNAKGSGSIGPPKRICNNCGTL